MKHRAVMVGALGAMVAAIAAVGFRPSNPPAPPPRMPETLSPAPLAASLPDRPRDGQVFEGSPRMLHLDPRRTNRSPFAGPTQPVIAWTFDTGGPIQAAPALLDDGTIVVASLSGRLFGLDRKGAHRFDVDLGGRIYGSPLVTKDGIFVGSDARRFFALDGRGRIRFRLETQGDADTGATITPGGGIVFAAGRMVYGIEPSGTVRFRVKTPRKTFTSPAVAENGTVFVGSQDDHVYAITSEGKIAWQRNLTADVDGGPAIADDGTVYVGTDGGEIVALDPSDGSVRWRRSLGGFVRGSISIGRDGTVLAGTYGPMPRLVALDPAQGELRFDFGVQGTGAREFGIHGGPVEDAEGRLYFGAQDDCVYALRPDGTLLWKLQTGGDIDAPIVIADDGTLLVGSGDGKLYAIGERR